MAIIDQAQAVQLLLMGKLVALPTDTVWGVAGDFHCDEVIEMIFQLKNRDKDKPLAVLISTEEVLSQLTDEVTDRHRLLISKFWPGALTLIFKKKPSVSDLITAGRQTIGLRMPAHETTRKIIAELGGVIVATSVNLSGLQSLNNEAEISAVFPDLPILENNLGNLNKESTVLDLTREIPLILRQGAISTQQIELVLQSSVEVLK